MQNRIEPPILISRLMTFVMAVASVVLFVLVLTLDKMFPLNRPQVFFLTTQMTENRELTLTEMPKPQDLTKYKVDFIREYVRERNEIVPDLAIMRAKWANSSTGTVKTRSSDAVFGKFAMTDMVNIIRQDLDEAFNIKCDVEFPEKFYVVPQTNAQDTYTVNFTYICRYGALKNQQYIQQYKLRVKLQSMAAGAVKWADRMENPLGIRVIEYDVIDNQGRVLDDDPLNWVSKE